MQHPDLPHGDRYGGSSERRLIACLRIGLWPGAQPLPGTHVAGTVVAHHPWGLEAVLDDRTAATPPPDAAWKPWFGRSLPGSRPVFGHCDTEPWNVVATVGRAW